MIYFSFLWQFIFIQVYLFPPKNLTWHVSFILTCLSSFSVNDFHSLGNSFCPIWCSVLQDLVRFLKQMIWSQICSEEKSTTGTQTFPVCSVHHVFGKCDQSKPRTRSLLHKHSGGGGGGAGTCRRWRWRRLQEEEAAGGCSHTETSSSVQIASRWGWEMSLRWWMTLLLLKHTVGVLETHEATGRDGLYSVTWCWEWRESRLFCQVRVSFL